MIKNIVFDIGNVLATFEPKVFLHDLLNDPSAEKAIYYVIFEDMTWWNLYNQGLYSAKDVVDHAQEKLPEYKKEIELVLRNWVQYVLPIPESMDVIEKYKDRYSLYIISDIPQDNFEYLSSHYDFIQKMKGGIYSYQHKTIKPDTRMFELLLEIYGLNADECVFIDDRIQNVEAARSVGFKAEQLKDYYQLSKLLEEMLNEM